MPTIKKITQKSRDTGRGVTEQSYFTSYMQDTLLVLYPWLGVQVTMYVHFWMYGHTRDKVQTYQDLIFCSWMFHDFSGSTRLSTWLLWNNKTHSWEHWGITRPKTILHVLCIISTLLMWQPTLKLSPTGKLDL